jgi:hypothetical protein
VQILVDAILMKILHLPPLVLLRALCVTFVIVGALASLAPSAFFELMEHTRKGKARRRRDVNEELQAKYDAMCRRVVEAEAVATNVTKENIRLAGLLTEECVHDRDWTLRTRRELDARKAAGQ